MNRIILSIVAAAVVAGGGAFYGGMRYAQSKIPFGLSQANFQNFRNLSSEERQQRLGQMGTAGLGVRGGGSRGRAGSDFVAGEIISKDDQSITVKLRDGGSKIIFYSDTTEVDKFVTGTANDFLIGKSVVVNGSANQDGSITAQSIRVVPESMNVLLR